VPTIKPEGELIEVVVEVTMLNAALVSAVQPPLKKRSCHVHAWQDLMRRFGTAADDEGAVWRGRAGGGRGAVKPPSGCLVLAPERCRPVADRIAACGATSENNALKTVGGRFFVPVLWLPQQLS
jgi:hypothetical protein